MTRFRIERLSVHKLDAPMREPFRIAGGTQTKVKNILVTIQLHDGTRGYGECAPLPAFNGETQKDTSAAIRQERRWLIGSSAAKMNPLTRRFARRLRHHACARAGIEMALLDAWCRSQRIPLHRYFGGAGERVFTDVTIPIVAPKAAARASRRIIRRGIETIKIKVGARTGDAERVIAAMSSAPSARLILDGNCGLDVSGALRLLRRLKSENISVALFEQPVPAADLAGLRAVSREGRIPVAADESAASARDVLKLIEHGAVQVVNLKLMKCGIFESREMARIARTAGLGLMIGGMIETRLAMTCAAHLASGFGGFSFIDLDTPLFLAEDPMRGLPLGPRGEYAVDRVASGIGITPKDRRG